MNFSGSKMVDCDPEVPHFNNTCQNLRCFYSYGTIVPIFGLFGLIGNGLSMYVLLQRRMRSFINILLAGLCGYDCVLLLSAFFVYVTLAYCQCLRSICDTLVAWLPIFFPLSQIDRWATPDRAKYALALVGAFAICLNGAVFFEIKYVPEFGLVPRDFRLHEAYQLWYKNVVLLALLYVVPFALLLSMNGILLYHLRNITVSGLLLNIAEAAEFGMTNAVTFQNLIYLGNVLVIINSATNLLIYCAAGRRFRQMFAEKVFGLKPSRPSTPASSRILLKRTSPLQQEACQYNSLDDTRELAEMIAEIHHSAKVDKTLF